MLQNRWLERTRRRVARTAFASLLATALASQGELPFVEPTPVPPITERLGLSAGPAETTRVEKIQEAWNRKKWEAVVAAADEMIRTNERDHLRVCTNQGEITCNLLVNAAGPWAGRLGNLPLTPLKRHLFVTTPLDWLDPDSPSVWDGTAGFYFRPESGRLLLSCRDETAAEPGDYSEDPDMLLELAEKVEMQQPGLGELAIARQWVGQRTFAPDRLFVIGFDTRNDKLFHVGGLGGHGVTSSFTVGRMAADLITGGRPLGAEPLSPRRLFSMNELNPSQS